MPDHESIKVVLRCRTRLARENDVATPNIITLDNETPKVTISIPESKKQRRSLTSNENDEANDGSQMVLNQANIINRTYSLDQVFGAGSDQLNVFTGVAEDMCDDFLRGYNCTIFAYGQTGSGKTYTMFGDTNYMERANTKSGIIPRCLERLFERSKGEIIWKCSFVEIYNEELRDLLGSGENDRNLKIYEQDNLIKIKGLEEFIIKDAKQGLKYLKLGIDRRETQSTKMNSYSSRSHTIFTIYMIKKVHDGKDYQLAKFNLVDLAGSENIRKSGSQNQRAKEAGSINQSLLTLGKVINSLAEKSKFIPYRESKLTRLLKDSLGGDTKTTLIATVSPTLLDLHSTISTLDYAAKAKNIQNSVQIGAIIKDQMIMSDLVEENRRLQLDLMATRRRDGHIYLDVDNYTDSILSNKILKSQVEELTLSRETLEVRMNELDERYQREKKSWIASVKQMENQIISLNNKCNEQLQIEDQLRLKNTNLGNDVLNNLTKLKESQIKLTSIHHEKVSERLSNAKIKLDQILSTLNSSDISNELEGVECTLQEVKSVLDTIKGLNTDSLSLNNKLNGILNEVVGTSLKVSTSKGHVKDLINIMHDQTEKLREWNLQDDTKEYKNQLENELGPSMKEFQRELNSKIQMYISDLFDRTFQSTQNHYSEAVSKSYINSQNFNNEVTKKLSRHINELNDIESVHIGNEVQIQKSKELSIDLLDSVKSQSDLLNSNKALIDNRLTNKIEYISSNNKNINYQIQTKIDELFKDIDDVESIKIEDIDFDELKTKISNLLMDKIRNPLSDRSPIKLLSKVQMRSPSGSRSRSRSRSRSMSPSKINNKRSKIE